MIYLKKIALIATATAMLLLASGSAFADQGGCPNDSSVNGASHANSNSAHGQAKQVERGCVVTPPVCDPATDPNCGPTG